MKDELVTTKQKLEKLYTSSEKIKEQISVQRTSYDKTRLGFFLGKSSKKSIEREEPNPKSINTKKNLDMIESANTPKGKENVIHSNKSKESYQE